MKIIQLKDYEFKMFLLFLISSLYLVGRKYKKWVSDTNITHNHRTTAALRTKISALEVELEQEAHLVRYVQIVNPEIFYSLMPKNIHTYKFTRPDDDKIMQIKNATLLHEKLEEEIEFLEEKLQKSRRMVQITEKIIKTMTFRMKM